MLAPAEVIRDLEFRLSMVQSEVTAMKTDLERAEKTLLLAESLLSLPQRDQYEVLKRAAFGG